MTRLRVALVAAFAAVVASASGAFPAPTLTLQTSFSPPTGISRVDGVDSTTSIPGASATDGDRIYTAGESGSGSSGDVVVLAHRLDGTLDPAFSDDGRVVIPVGPANVEDRAVDIVVLPDHSLRVLVATATSTAASARDSAIVGLTAQGAPDTAFGAWESTTPADGIVFLGSSVSPVVHTPNVPAALALAPDGRLAVAGRVVGSTDDSFVAVRAADGSPAAFGGDSAGIVQFDQPGNNTQDLAVDVVWRSNGGVLVLGSAGALGTEVAYLRAYTAEGARDDSFDGDSETPVIVGEPPTVPAAMLVHDGTLWLAGSTRTGADTNAFLARMGLDGSGLQSRQFDMRGQLIDPSLAVTSAVDSLALVPGTPDTLVVAGSVASASGTDWSAAAFNDLGTADINSLGFGDIAISAPGDFGLAGVTPVSGQRVAIAGNYRETVTTPSSSVTYSRTGVALLAVDAEKRCNLALSISRPLELVTPPGRAAPVAVKVVNNGARSCSGTVSVPAPWSLAGAADTGPLAPGTSRTLTDLSLTYAGSATGETNIDMTLTAGDDIDTSDNTARLHVRFGLCDVALEPFGGRTLIPSEGSRRFAFSLTNGGTTSCSKVRLRVTGQGIRTSRPLPFDIPNGREFSDTPAIGLRKPAKVGAQVLIGVAAVSGSTDLGPAGNDVVALTPRVLGVGDSDAFTPRGRARLIRGTARGGRGPATRKQRRVRDVSVAVRRVGGGCRWLSDARRVRFRKTKPAAKGRCPRPVWLPARGTARWSVRTGGLPAGRYELLSRATIGVGFREARFTVTDRNRLRFAVRK